jgi:hypothetical protein
VLQNSNIVIFIIEQEADDDKIVYGNNINLPSLSDNCSTGAKTISSPPANSFVISSNFEERNNFLILELYCLFINSLSKEVVILCNFQLYLIIRSVLLILQEELIQFFLAVVVLVLNLHSRNEQD